MASHHTGRGPAPVDHEGDPVVGPLGGLLRRGAAISGFTLVLVQVTSLVTTLMLARLLTPQEVGVYAAGTVLTGFLIMFAEGGLRGALVQREKDVEDSADTVFWATAATGLAMSLSALAAAPLVALVFRNPLAGEIAAVTSGMLLMHALTNVPDGLLQRRFNFKRRLIVDPARAFTFGAVAVALAAAGLSVWALVIGNYASMAVWLIGCWVLGRWRPGRGTASIRLWRELARFGFPLLVQSVVWQVREAGQAGLVGRFLGEAALGHFRYGRRVGLVPAQAVVQVGSYVLFPAFSRLASDPERLKQAFLRSLRWLWLAAAPLGALIIAIGEPAVVVLLGDRWRAAGVFLVAMAGYGASIGLKATAGEVIKGSGRSKLLNWPSAVQLVLGVGLVVLALPYHLVGVGLAISVTEITLTVLVLGLARSVVGFSMAELFRLLVPPLVGSLVALAVVGPLELFVAHSDQRSLVLGLLLLTGETIGFAAIYLATLRVLDPPAVIALVALVRRKLARQRGGDAPG